MHICVALTLTMQPAMARADDGDKYNGAEVAAIYYEVRSNCRMGETANGHQLTREESDKECLILDALGGQLKSHGYC
jgi:hypothetical protein